MTAPSNQASALQTTPLRPAAFQSSGALASSYRVQIAAVVSDEAARREWLRYQGRHPDLLGRLSLLVQQAEVNNRNYFRVQAGPLDEAGARRLCNALKSQDVDCLVVRP